MFDFVIVNLLIFAAFFVLCSINVVYFSRSGPIIDRLKRRTWIEAIETYQPFNYFYSKFYVCELHFSPKEIRRFGGRVSLAPGAVPTIFPQR